MTIPHIIFRFPRFCLHPVNFYPIQIVTFGNMQTNIQGCEKKAVGLKYEKSHEVAVDFCSVVYCIWQTNVIVCVELERIVLAKYEQICP